MISRNCLVADALSGADYDGDLVKIYADKIIVDAIKKGCYCESEVKNKDGENTIKVQKRKDDIPIVSIPSTKSADIPKKIR